jgi:hypothetical protein
MTWADLVAVVAALTVGACGASASRSPPATPSGPASATEGRIPAIKACEASVSSISPLDYMTIETGKQYRVVMAVDSHREWKPVDEVPEPYHYSTLLALDNLAEFHELEQPSTPVQFILEITSQEIARSARAYVWFATYHARILEICAPERGSST